MHIQYVQETPHLSNAGQFRQISGLFTNTAASYSFHDLQTKFESKLCSLKRNTKAMSHGHLKVSGTQIVDSSGEPVILRGAGLGGWMNMENFITGYPGHEHQHRAAMLKVLGEEKYNVSPLQNNPLHPPPYIHPGFTNAC